MTFLQKLKVYFSFTCIKWLIILLKISIRTKRLCNLCNLSKSLFCLFEVLLVCWHYFESAFIFLLTLTYIFPLLQPNGNIDPVPQKLKPKSLLVCHWNLNILTAHHFSKFTLPKLHISMYKHDFICLSETYVDSTIPCSLLNPHMHETFLQCYYMKWVPGDPLKEMIN